MKLLRRTSGGRRRGRGEEGQSLLETAVAMPLLMALAFNVINVGYFWFLVLALSAAPRQGVQYASQGWASVQKISAPGTVAATAFASASWPFG